MPDNDNTPATAPDVPAPDVQISLRMPGALLARIDREAERLSVNRASIIRMVLATALPAPAKGD